MSTKLKLLLVLVLVAGLLAGQHLSVAPIAVPKANASCFAGWAGCGMDNTRTSTLRVLHQTNDATPIRVAPDTQDVWYVTATYSPKLGCTDTLVYATVTVTNTGSGYSVSCAGCTTFPFMGVGICAPSNCASGTDYEYTVKLDMDFSYGAGDLTNVNYSSTSIDDGEEIDSSCSTGTTVSPTSQSWSADDTTFPCSYDCTNDTLVTITYN